MRGAKKFFEVLLKQAETPEAKELAAALQSMFDQLTPEQQEEWADVIASGLEGYVPEGYAEMFGTDDAKFRATLTDLVTRIAGEVPQASLEDESTLENEAEASETMQSDDKETIDLQSAFTAGRVISQDEGTALGLKTLRSIQDGRIKLLDQAVGHSLPAGTIGEVEAAITFGDVVNSEGHVYTTELWQRQLTRLKAMAQENRLLGMLDHPVDGRNRLTGNALRWQADSIRMEGNALMGRAYIMNSTAGHDLYTYLQNGVPIETSTRGLGSTTPTSDWRGNQDVQMVDEDTYICNGLDAVYRGASADGLRRPAMHLQSATNEEDYVMDPKLIQELKERLEVLQAKGFGVASLLEQLEQLGDGEEATKTFAKVQSFVEAAETVDVEALIARSAENVEEQAAEEPPADKEQGEMATKTPKEQVYVEPITFDTPNGTIIIVPKALTGDGSDQGTPAQAPAGESPQVVGSVEVAAASNASDLASSLARTAAWRQDVGQDDWMRKAMLSQQAQAMIQSVEDETSRKLVARKLESANYSNPDELKQAFETAKADADAYAEITGQTRAPLEQGVPQGWGTPQRGVPDPAKVPATTPVAAIDKLIQENEEAIQQNEALVEKVTGGRKTFGDEHRPAIPGAKGVRDAIKASLYQWCLTPKIAGARGGPMWDALLQHMAIEQALFEKRQTALEDILHQHAASMPLDKLLQTPGTASTITTGIASTPAMMLRVLPAYFPRLIMPVIASVQPTTSKNATAYYEDFQGTSVDSQLVGTVGSGSSPMLPLDNLYYHLWENYQYSDDPGEMETVSKLKYTITSSSVECDIKKLGVDWSWEVQFDLLADYDIDILTRFATQVAAQIARERNDQFLDMLLAGVPAGHQHSYETTPASGVDPEWWEKKIFAALSHVAQLVYQTIYRMPRILITTSDVCERLASVTRAAGRSYGFQQSIVEGVELMNNVDDRWVVFNYARWGNYTDYRDKALALFRGPDWFETPAVFLPRRVETSKVDEDPDTQKRSMSMAEESGKFLANASFLGQLTVDTSTTAADSDPFN